MGTKKKGEKGKMAIDKKMCIGWVRTAVIWLETAHLANHSIIRGFVTSISRLWHIWVVTLGWFSWKGDWERTMWVWGGAK